MGAFLAVEFLVHHLFHLVTGAEPACPGPLGIVIKGFIHVGGGWIVACGDIAVMHQPMRRCMVADQHRNVDPHAQLEQTPVAVVDQFMGIGVADLPEIKSSGQKQQDRTEPAQARDTGQPQHHHQQQQEMGGSKGDAQLVGGGKFLAVNRRHDHRRPFIQHKGEQRQIAQRQQSPPTAKQRRQQQQWHRHQSGKGETRHGIGHVTSPSREKVLGRRGKIPTFLGQSCGKLLSLAGSGGAGLSICAAAY